MAKLKQGRFGGWMAMKTFTADELHDIADKFQAEIDNPDRTDDIRWLQRRLKSVRDLAEQKEKALDHKSRQ